MPYRPRFASLTPAQLRTVQELENELGVHLLAVATTDTLYQLEIRAPDGRWLPPAEAHEKLAGFESLFAYKSDAQRAKGTLKNKLANLGAPLRAVRIRLINHLSAR